MLLLDSGSVRVSAGFVDFHAWKFMVVELPFFCFVFRWVLFVVFPFFFILPVKQGVNAFSAYCLAGGCASVRL